VALAAGLLAFFLSRVDLAQIGRRIAEADRTWLAGSFVIALSTFALRAWRWTWMLRPIARVPFSSAFFATAVGFAANTVLPARAGEIVRPALLARERRLPFSPLLASILLERILDAACVLLFLLIALAQGPPPGGSRAFEMLARGAVVPALLLAGVVAMALLAVFRRAAADRIFQRLTRRLPRSIAPRAQSFAAAFLDGFRSLREPRLALQIVAGSLFMWFVINVQVYAVLRAFGLDYPFSASYVTTAAAVLGLALPTPGGIGGYHAAVQVALTDVYGAPVAEASGVALLAHAISFVPITLIGFLFLALSPTKLRLSEVAESASTRET
jgi:uncharacterized protein (TIRG00374 family)